MMKAIRNTALCSLLLLAACSGEGSTGPSTDSTNVNWLESCGGSATCAPGLECLCGVCHYACDDNGSCNQGQCVTDQATIHLACTAPLPTSTAGVCLVNCNQASDCPAGFCTQSWCGPDAPTTDDPDASFPEADTSIEDVLNATDTITIDPVDIVVPDILQTADANTATDGSANADTSEMQDVVPDVDRVAPSCRIEPLQTVGEYTPEFTGEPACNCTLETPSCHILYRARVVSLTGNVVLVEGAKTPINAGNPEPSAEVQTWLLQASGETLDCNTLDTLNERATGRWSAGTSFRMEGSVWPTTEAFEAAAEGDEIWLSVVTGGGAAGVQNSRVFFQAQALGFRKVCE